MKYKKYTQNKYNKIKNILTSAILRSEYTEYQFKLIVWKHIRPEKVELL